MQAANPPSDTPDVADAIANPSVTDNVVLPPTSTPIEARNMALVLIASLALIFALESA